MHTENLELWQHEHVFDSHDSAAERGTRAVMWITALMMAVEIAAGWWFNSMALLADGWHMGSHVLAIGLSAFAYAMSRRYARDPRFAFGTAKVEVLAGYTSAWLLVGMAVLMLVASVERMLGPRPVQYEEAMIVAAIGLVVNIVCAWILGRAHDHHHEDHARSGDHAAHDHGHAHRHDHHHGHDHGHHHDLNLRSAYLHVVADAATSVFAIVALAGGWRYGWTWLDPLMGIVGSILVGTWARKLISQTARVLLDREMDLPIVRTIREAAESGQHDSETTVTDLHVWRVGRNAHACAMTLVTHDRTLSASKVRAALALHRDVAHATIEIHYCPEADHVR